MKRILIAEEDTDLADVLREALTARADGWLSVLEKAGL